MVARMMKASVFLYGPPGSGKSAAGRKLADNLGKPFYDLDEEIEKNYNQIIQQIFKEGGEAGFRKIEKESLRRLPLGVVALGGGSLLDEENRAWAQDRGTILVLTAPLTCLIQRLRSSSAARPLLDEDLENNLSRLLAQRADHYASFERRIDTGRLSVEETAWEAQIALGLFRIRSMGNYAIHLQNGGIHNAGDLLPPGTIPGRAALISDETVGPLYASSVVEGLQSSNIDVFTITIPSGEKYKTIETLTMVWDQLLENGLGRDGLILSLGGGVVSDLAGFAAATFLRGVRWAALPTTLLSMVDASLGGKTGIDLARGKNLAGAFYPPIFVLADPLTLATLPDREWRSGMGEVVKHALIADTILFSRLDRLANEGAGGFGPEIPAEILRRAAGVKVQIIERDPYEKGEREALNFGHTIGHAVEQASGYQILHGEAVSIGMVIECKLSEEIGLAQQGLSKSIADVLERLGLPIRLPDNLDREAFIQAMQVDKKKKNGKIRFSLPVRIGEVRTGIEIDDLWRKDVFDSGTARPQSELARKA
jgi:shikimate kinase / 3-dehydroquinate synthase